MVSYISTHPSLKVALLVALLSACLTFACLLPTLLVALITALLLAFVLRIPVNYLEISLGLNRTVSIAIVFLVVAAFLALSAATGIPILLDHAKELYTSLKNFPFDQKLNELVQNLSKGVPFINPQSATQKVRAYVNESLQSAGESLTSSAGAAISFFIVPFVTYFALAEGDKAVKRLVEQVPNKYFEMTLNVVDKIRTDLVGYLRGWILDSVIVGILNVVGFYLIGIKYPFLLGFIAGLANLIPYVGPLIGLVPPFVMSIAQTGDLSAVPSIALLTVVIQTIDNLMVQPLCFAKTVDMHPLTVIIVCFVGNQLMGVLGMLLAIPLYTIVKVTAVETYWGLKHYRITF